MWIIFRKFAVAVIRIITTAAAYKLSVFSLNAINCLYWWRHSSISQQWYQLKLAKCIVVCIAKWYGVSEYSSRLWLNRAYLRKYDGLYFSWGRENKLLVDEISGNSKSPINFHLNCSLFATYTRFFHEKSSNAFYYSQL